MSGRFGSLQLTVDGVLAKGVKGLRQAVLQGLWLHAPHNCQCLFVHSEYYALAGQV